MEEEEEEEEENKVAAVTLSATDLKLDPKDDCSLSSVASLKESSRT